MSTARMSARWMRRSAISALFYRRTAPADELGAEMAALWSISLLASWRERHDTANRNIVASRACSGTGAGRSAMADPAAHAEPAATGAKRQRADQRHPHLVRHLRRRSGRAGHPAAWRSRQFRLLGQPGTRA